MLITTPGSRRGTNCDFSRPATWITSHGSLLVSSTHAATPAGEEAIIGSAEARATAGEVARAWSDLYASPAYTNAKARVQEDSSSSASNRRCLSVSAPSILVSLMWCRPRNFLHLVVPQRRWLISSSPIAHVSASSGGSRMTSAAAASPSAILRFSSARANLTVFARSSARSLCGAGLTVAVSDIWCFASSHSSAWADLDFFANGQGSTGAPSRGSCTARCFSARRSARFCSPPVSGLPYPSGHLPCSAVSVGEEATPSARITATSQMQAMRSERVFFVSERLVRVWTRRRRYSWFTFAGGA